ncbi:HlyD family type I secretion periplasmic adaptor subunit [Bosea sp. F3-2]|uniref:HlyD family type I secretion periplasmic adaptor subunit n=1 Tax=Bosea sp. F3-2 TaxID=2599640 RepID=UPI0011F08D9B|nr:HlyD family type I secretion periplasmic adaptor subunit [Bosea sp. F3-2]QEL22103.1 HlyD family type I secretion periplasmic adaptor subunit [Bosea sp. F3-2]
MTLLDSKILVPLRKHLDERFRQRDEAGREESAARIAALQQRQSVTAARADANDPSDLQPSDSIREPALFGWLVILLFFGALGGWALFAPLNGAVVANGVVKVEGNRKSVQHLDGGIVKGLSVKEGDRVKIGDLLILLDDTQARAEFQVLLQQHYLLRATGERLKAELARGATLVMPADLSAAQRNDPDVANIWTGQVQQMESRRAALEGQRSVIRERIAQYEAQIKGSEAQAKAYQAQLQSVRKEIASIAPLVEKGLISMPRRLQLERTGSQLEGQAADTVAGIAKARQAIAEQQQQIVQLDNERVSDVSKELKDTQAKELETLSRLNHARAVLSRSEIRAPYAGQVVGLNVFSVGGVIVRGEKILDLVPEQDSLVVEAQIAVEDISDVHPDMQADIHLTAYKQRITPVVRGTVLRVSADRLLDNKTGSPYYTAEIKLDDHQLTELPQIKLYPGMPANVIIQTIERTAFDYIVGPLTMSFHRAFRQK